MMNSPGLDRRKPMDWRILFGLCLTSAWMLTGIFYLLAIVGWSRFVDLPTADIGSFLEGAFAPLAFLWLVIGHFMQQSEISANTKAISIQEKSARRLELHSRRDSYFKLHSLVQNQLGTIAAFHYVSVCGPTGTGEYSQQEFTEQRSAINNGDYSFFIVKLLLYAFSHTDDIERFTDIFYGTEIRRRHTNNFESTFDKLLEEAREIDTDGLISNALYTGSAEGRFYKLIRHMNGKQKDNTMDSVPSPLPLFEP